MTLSSAHISDRRAHDRHAIRTEVILDLADGRRAMGMSMDIGMGGAGVVCDLNLPEGTRLRLRLRLPGQTPGANLFDAEGAVVNSILARREGGFRLGVQFDPLSPQAEAVLKAFHLP